MGLVISIVVMIIMAVVASKKGFNLWLWILAGGIPGFIILLCMPSAAAAEIDEATRERRRKAGNTTGDVISVISIFVIIGLIRWIFRL